ncbi:MAG TPA: Maebl [Firmicutes bacterium]|nr:Maebl [Bacillota bacterium]
METETLEKEYTIALLIDAENISYKYIPYLIEELKGFGKLTIRRVYGDFTTAILKPWKDICNEHAIKPIQGNVVSSGKNNSDSALIIDAMDILHDKKVNAFCLATSDSDFTSLAIRIREEGLFVIGAGENKTTKAFIETCDRFIRLGNEENKKNKIRKTKGKNSKDSKIDIFSDFDEVTKEKISEIKARSLLIIENRGGGEAIKLALFMNDLYRYYPDFNVFDFGFKTNIEFFKSLGFSIKKDEKSALIIK